MYNMDVPHTSFVKKDEQKRKDDNNHQQQPTIPQTAIETKH